jgi:hypothetical protein
MQSQGTKLHFKSPTAERRHVLCVGVGGDRIHAGPLRKSMPALTSRLRGASQVLYLLPITSILGPRDQCLFLFATKEPSNPPAQGDKDFPGASCDSKMSSGDDNQWSYINSLAMNLGLSGKRANKLLCDQLIDQCRIRKLSELSILLLIYKSIGVSGSRDILGLCFDFGCPSHVPPDVSTLSLKPKHRFPEPLSICMILYMPTVRWVPRIYTVIQDFNPFISDTLYLCSCVYT